MATSPIYGWAEPDNTDLVKNGALAIRTLGNAIDTTMGTMTPKSTVTAKGSLIAATAASTPANLSVGNNGEALYADSSATTGLRYVATPSASNPVLNSGFNVWQRGTSISVPSAFSTYAADRFQVFNAGANEALTVARQPTNDTTNLPFIQYCTRFQRNSGQTGTTLTQYGQTLDSVNSIPFAGKTITFSFYARKGADFSATSNTLAYSVQSGTGTDQNVFTGFTGATNVIGQAATLTANWQRFTFTSTSVFPITATQLGLQFAYTPTGTAGTNDYYEVTGVQIDIGNVALPYRAYAATFQGELAACQRYYYRTTAGALFGYFSAGNNYGATSNYSLLNLPVTLRTAPASIETTGTASNYRLAGGGVATTCSVVPAIDQTGTNQISILATVASGLTVGYAASLGANNTTSAYIGVSAEL